LSKAPTSTQLAPSTLLITEDEVQKTAHLARLSLDENNLNIYTKSLSDILDMIARINDTDTTHIAPMASPLLDAAGMPTGIPLRDDRVTEETNQRSLYQSTAKQVESGLYLVPQVIE